MKIAITRNILFELPPPYFPYEKTAIQAKSAEIIATEAFASFKKDLERFF